MAISFKGAHFPQEIILMGVRWSVAYPLSAAPCRSTHAGTRWLPLDHATIKRWVVTYSPPLEAAFHRSVAARVAQLADGRYVAGC